MALLAFGSAAGVHAEGGLDTSFDNDGKVNTDFGAQEVARAVAVQPDGKVVVAGSITFENGARDFLVVRYKANGSLDTAFGINGKVTQDFVGFNDEAYGVAIQSDGKIVVAGYALKNFSESDFALARYNGDGTLDWKTTTDIDNDGDVAYAVSIQGDGKILAAGEAIVSGSNRDFALVRYLPDGAIDLKVTTDFQGNDKARSVVSLPNGKILVAGERRTGGGNRDFALARYHGSGELDRGFDIDGDGKVITDFMGTDDTAAAVALQPDGKIVAVGQTSSDLALARYGTNGCDGCLDSTFHADGLVTTHFFSFDEAVALAFQADKILVAGVTQTGSGGYDFALVRYTSEGVLDPTFGNGGIIPTDFAIATSLDFASAMTVQPDGKVLLAGTVSGTTGNDFGLARYVTTSPATSIQFSQASYSAAETSNDSRTEPVAVINVTRSGDLSKVSTVQYQTLDDPSPVPCDPTVQGYPQGLSYARCDYATTSGTLLFGIGESQKSFRIPLVNDSHVEPSEIFTIVLSNPEEAALEAQYSAVVTIADDDMVVGPDPINSHPVFVRQQYIDFLSREPEAWGFDAWLGTLNNCPDAFNTNTDPNSPSANCDRIHVSSGFFRSQEFEIKGLYVFKFYRAALHVTPESLPAYAEIIRDIQNVTGVTAEEVYAKKAAYANAFAQRFAFRAAYDNVTNPQYVDALLGPYNLTAINTKDPESPDTGIKVTLTRAELTSRLEASTLTRAQVLRAVVDSDEVSAAEFNGAFVAMQYYGYLRRTPEAGGYLAWLGHLNANPGDFRRMVYGFLYSAEYRLRFGPLS